MKYLYFILIAILLIQCKPKNDTELTQNTHKHPHYNKELEDIWSKFNELEYLNDTIKYDSLYNLIYQKSTQLNNLYYIGLSHIKLGDKQGYLGHNNNTLENYEKAKDIFITIQDSINIYEAYKKIAFAQAFLNDYISAEINAIEAINHIPNKNNSIKCNGFQMMGYLTASQGDCKEAIYWYNKSLSLPKIDPDQINLAKANLAFCYMELGDHTKSNIFFEEILNDSIAVADKSFHGYLLNKYAINKWRENPSVKIDSLLYKALELRKETHNLAGLTDSYNTLTIYFTNKNKKLALENAYNVYNLTSQHNNKKKQQVALTHLIKLEEPQKAKIFAKQYIQLSDSLAKVSQRTRNEYARAKFDSDMIKLENTKLEAEELNTELKLKRTSTYIYISIFIFLIIIVYSVYFYRYNQIKNENFLAQGIRRAEQKLANKINDELANHLYMIVSYINNNDLAINPNDKSLIIQRLDSIYSLSKDILRESQKILTDENYPDEIINLISIYKNQNTNIILINFQPQPWSHVNEEIKQQFYKILQELLTNMKKHSKAKLVTLTFNFNKNKFYFTYTDNGTGITKETFSNNNHLKNLKSRIKSLSGNIRLEKSKSKSTIIKITIPLNRAN